MKRTVPPLDLNDLEDAPVIVIEGDEPCVDLDGEGTCVCSPTPEGPDLLALGHRHMVVRGVNADGTPFTSNRYFRL